MTDELDEILNRHRRMIEGGAVSGWEAKDKAKTDLLAWHKAELERIIGEYSQYPSHYTISDVLAEQRRRAGL